DPAPTRRRLNDTSRETLQLFRTGRSVQQIAADRGLVVGTIYTHLENAILAGENVDVGRLISPEQSKKIAAAFAAFGYDTLAGVLERLGDGFDYGQLKIYRAATMREKREPG